jgi:hypothetical protein
MRRIFLVFAMLALLMITAMPAMAQSGGNNGWWDDKDWGDGDKDWEDEDKDWEDEDKDWEGHHNNSQDFEASIWCGWFPSFWGWDLWCFSPWFGWWEAS